MKLESLFGCIFERQKCQRSTDLNLSRVNQHFISNYNKKLIIYQESCRND